MTTHRQIAGTLVFPPDALSGAAERLRVELRDTSLQDQPSTLLASLDLPPRAVSAGLRVPFSLRAPEAEAGRSLSLRVQVDLAAASLPPADPAGPPGRLPMLLSTVHTPVPARGAVTGLTVALEQLRS